MKSRLLLSALSVSLLCTAAPCPAEDAAAGRMRELFTRADADASGSLSPEEQTHALATVKKTYGAEWARRIEGMFRSAAEKGSVSAAAWTRTVDAFTRPVDRRTEKIAMRDGTLLATDIYTPAGGAGPFPVVLSRTPYDRTKRSAVSGSFTRDGCVFVIQDMRGRFASAGQNLPFVGCGWGEHQDGVDTVAWLKKQPWCNGRIATIGGSAGGITQNLLAGAAPDGLCAQYISVAACSLYPDAGYPGCAFRKADIENWMTGNHFDPAGLDLMRSRPGVDDYWRQYDTSARFAQMNVPAVHIGGWFDMFAQGTIDQFVGRQHHGAPGARGAQKLIMGPWTHGIGRMPVGDLTFPNAQRPPAAYDSARWFARYLQGQANGVDQEPAVAYYVMGDAVTPGAPGNEWRYAADWPIPAKETAAYLLPDRTLSLTPPPAGGTPLVYTFDPANPCPTVGGNNLTIPAGPMDQRKVEDRPDVLTFTSDIIEKPVEVTGRIRARVFVSSSAADTDISVRLCDVYPDGRSLLIAEGIQRLRYRKSPSTPEPLTPGRVEEVNVDCWSTSIIFNKGHRARVTITSSNYPRFDLNPGTGQPWSDTGPAVKQTNRIHCDAEHPSRLIVPVVE